MFNHIAEMFGTDITTLYKSLGIGGTSTGVGYIAKAQSVDWNVQANLVDLCWAVLTCIVLTIISLLITKTYKRIEKRLSKK